MIEGTKVADDFEKIYATSFYYNDNDVAVWPAQVVNYTNKTQFLFRIEKGVLDINDPGVNDSFDPSEIRVPFRNMIYIDVLANFTEYNTYMQREQSRPSSGRNGSERKRYNEPTDSGWFYRPFSCF